MKILGIAVICVLMLLQTACRSSDPAKPRSFGRAIHQKVADTPNRNRPSVSEHAGPADTSGRRAPPSAPPATTLVPTWLEIPAIRLTTKVVPVGVLPSGAMDVPKAFDRVGLLYPATLPGENGNAVIDGHVDHYTGPAVFFYLKRLKPGDQLIVSDDQGKSLTFVVSSVEAFRTKEAPTASIFGPADRPRLNLITCTGKFNKKTKEHAQRLVVFSELQRPHPPAVSGHL